MHASPASAPAVAAADCENADDDVNDVNDEGKKVAIVQTQRQQQTLKSV